MKSQQFTTTGYDAMNGNEDYERIAGDKTTTGYDVMHGNEDYERIAGDKTTTNNNKQQQITTKHNNFTFCLLHYTLVPFKEHDRASTH